MGLPLGKYMAVAFLIPWIRIYIVSPLLFIPLPMYYLLLSAVVFIIIAHRLAIRGIKRIDLVEALKNVD